MAIQKTILIVDDEKPIRDMLRRILTQEGHRVLEAPNGREGVALFESGSDTVDLVITDVAMPYMTGQELAQRVRLQKPQTHILFMSGATDEASLGLSARQPGIDFLSKPFTIQELLAKIHSLLTPPKEPA